MRVKVIVALALAACACLASADVIIGPGGGVVSNAAPFTVSEPTRYTGSTNVYTFTSGYGAIDANLTLENSSYLRLVGLTTQTPERGVYIATNANADLTISINSKSGFYASYRNSNSPDRWVKTGIEPKNSSVVASYMKVRLGIPNGEKDTTGLGRFVVNAVGSGFGDNIKGLGLWIHYFSVESSAKANAEGYIDALRIDSSGIADFGQFANNNTNHPVRILFNGGYLRNNFANSVDSKQLVAAKDAKIVLEGIDGKDIIIRKEYTGNTLNSGKGTIRFQGDCNVRFRDGGGNLPETSGANRFANVLVGTASGGPIEWGNTKAVIIESNGFLRTDADDLLPYRTDEPIVRLEGNGILDLNGHSSKVRTLIGASGTLVTNVTSKTATTSKLVFGDGDTDGIFSGRCTYGVSVEKIGSGTLVISNATVEGTVNIKAGRVRFVGVNQLPNLVIDSSVKVIASVEETSDSIKRLIVDVPSGRADLYEHDAADETLLRAGDELGGMRFDIKAGKVRFAGDCTDKFWRWTIKAGMNPGTGALGGINTELSAMWFWPSNYVMVSSASADYRSTPTYGIVTNSAAEQALITSPSQLDQGRCMAEPAGITWEYDRDGSGRDYDGPDMIFNNSSALLWHVQKNPDGSASRPSLDDTNSWYSVAFRLKDTASPVAGYSVCRTHWSTGAGAWILSSSATGEDGTWKVRDEHTVQWANTVGMTSADADLVSEYPHCDDNNPETGKSQKTSEKWYNNKVIYRFTAGGTAAESFTNVRVRVAVGAILDTSYIKDEVLSFSELDIDGEGGTITKFAPAENGRLNLTGITMSAKMKKILTVGEVVNAGNFSTWKVYVDGVEVTGSRISFVDGELRVGVKPGLILGIECEKLFTPETSQHFRRYEDPYSGVVSYILDTRLGYNQQSFYFTHNSMTDDGRFLLFSVSASHESCTRYLGMVDFRYDTCAFIDATGWMPYIAMESDTLYYVNSGGFFKRNLRRAPTNEVFVCAIPEALKAEGNRIYRYCTHLTLTQDRKGAFLDLRIDDRFVQGMVHLDTCTWEKWGETDFHINHGQLNPHCDQLALCAYETVAWTDTKGVVHEGLELVDGIYPRLQLIAKDFRKMVPAKVFNYASHEKWAADGRGFYWCGTGVWHHDLFTENQTCLMPLSAGHSTCSADLGLVTYDAGVKGSFRGQPWQVGFYNRATGRGTYIFSRREAYCTRDNESEMHPDPHPQIVCRDRYIVCTVNHGDGRMDLAVTPVAPLVAMTTPKKGDPFGELVGFDSPYTFAMRFAERISNNTRVTDAALYDKIVEIGERYGNLSFVTNMIAKGGRPSGVGVIAGVSETPQEIMASQRDDGLWGEGTDPDLEKSAAFVRRLVIAYRDANGKGALATQTAAAAVRAWRALAAKMGDGGTYPTISQPAIAAIIDCALLME